MHTNILNYITTHKWCVLEEMLNLQKRVPCMTGELLDWERTAGRRMAGILSFD